MNWHTGILLTVSIAAAASLSCHGPETAAFNSKIVVKSNDSSPTQSFLGKETAKSEIEAKVPEWITLAGCASSFLSNGVRW